MGGLSTFEYSHDGVALMTASEIGDWYRGETATKIAPTD